MDMPTELVTEKEKCDECGHILRSAITNIKTGLHSCTTLRLGGNHADINDVVSAVLLI